MWSPSPKKDLGPQTQNNTTQHNTTQHNTTDRRTMSNSSDQYHTEDEPSSEDEIKNSTKRKTKSKPTRPKKKSKDTKAKTQSAQDTHSNDDNEEIRDSKQKFYQAMENNCDKFIPSGARSKFPMKEKIPDIVNLIENKDEIPTCSQKNGLLRKWCVHDGKLCSVPKKDGDEFKLVIAYEDIFDQIFNIDRRKHFKKSIEGLSQDVKEENNNISEKMIQLYSRVCHKRDHKQRGLTPKKQKDRGEEERRKAIVDEFREKLRECTTVGYFERRGDDDNDITASEQMVEEIVQPAEPPAAGTEATVSTSHQAKDTSGSVEETTAETANLTEE